MSFYSPPPRRQLNPHAQALTNEHRRWQLSDPIHGALSSQALSLPLFNDEWHGSSEHREWQLVGATQQVPVIHVVHQHHLSNHNVNQVQMNTQAYVWPLAAIPISANIPLAPHLQLTLRSQLPVPWASDDLSGMPTYMMRYARMLARYDGQFMGESDSTFSTKLGVSQQSVFASMLVKLNPKSSGASGRFPFYLAADTTARAVSDTLLCTQSSLKLHCLPFSGDDNRLRLLSLEAKHELNPIDDRWRGRVSYTHEISAPQPDTRILDNQQFVPPAFKDAAQQVSEMPLAVTASNWTSSFKSKLSQVRDRYFPDLFDRPPASETFKLPSLPSQTTPVPRSYVPWSAPTHLTFAVSSPMTFLPHTVAPLAAFRLNDSPLSHYTRDTAASIGLSIYPNSQTMCNIETMFNNEAQSTFLTINAKPSRSENCLYVNAGAVKHKSQSNLHFHFGFGLAVGGRY